MNNYDLEAKERWGGTAEYREYEKKTVNYTKEKWQQAKDELNGVFAKFAECLQCGYSADLPEVQGLVAELNNHITENYYECTNEILAGLGQMYVADERFKTNIDKNYSGTAEFVSKAIKIYCD